MLIDIFIIAVVFSPALERYNDEHIHRCFFSMTECNAKERRYLVY